MDISMLTLKIEVNLVWLSYQSHTDLFKYAKTMFKTVIL